MYFTIMLNDYNFLKLQIFKSDNKFGDFKSIESKILIFYVH